MGLKQAKVTGSSISVYDLKIGDFESALDDPLVPVELIGYYPTMLYSKKVFVIPEVLNKHVLHPISLTLDKVFDANTQFVGMAFNSDLSKNRYFSLGSTPLSTNVPEHILTFYFYFDMVTGYFNGYLTLPVRFNLAEIVLTHDDAEGIPLFFGSISIDVVFTSRNDNPEDSSEPENVHVGNLEFILNFQIESFPLLTEMIEYSVVKSPENSSFEIVNIPHTMYRTKHEDDLGLVSLLSSQVLLFTVSQPEPTGNTQTHLDMVKRVIRYKLACGFGNAPSENSLTYLDDLSQSTGLYFDVKFRKSSYFYNFKDKQHMPMGSHRLRLLDFMVFRGDKITEQHTDTVGQTDVSVLAHTFEGEQVFLASSAHIGPYIRFSTDAAIADYAERTLLDNLVFDLSTRRVLQRATISNCLHQIDPDFCLFCKVGYVLTSDHRACRECSSASFMQNSVESCVEPGTPSYRIINSNLQNKTITLQDKDLENLGNLTSVKTEYYQNFIERDTLGDIAPPMLMDISTFQVQILPKLNDDSDLVHFLSLEFHYEVPDQDDFEAPTLNLVLKNDKDSKTVHSEFDAGKLNLSSTEKYSISLFTLHGNEFTLPLYNEVNFLLNIKSSTNVSLDKGYGKTKIEYTSFPLAQLLNYLESATVYDTLVKVHPFSFPLDLYTDNFVYRGFGLTSYLALPFSFVFEKKFDNFYFDNSVNGIFFSFCGTGCRQCQNLFTCEVCFEGFYLNNSACTQCSAECESCKAHSEQCLKCADGSSPPSRSLRNS